MSRHIFYFHYQLERGDDMIEVEVAYGVDDDEMFLAGVTYDGHSLLTTPDEDKELLAHASEQLTDDMDDEGASYADYQYETRRDREDRDDD